jgi:hypothetical protein
MASPAITKTMDLFHLEKKLRQLRGDESGSVLLLSGMMSFLIAIMAMYAVDTSQAVYNRITSQNAADSAAETAALWQARGLNVEQQLNDFHYIFNETLFGVEWGLLASCVGADAAVANYVSAVACCASLVGAVFSGGSCCEDIPSDFDDAQNMCELCKQALPENQYQSTVSSQILEAQQGISDFFPALEVLFASQAAQETGADPVLNVIPAYLSSAVSGLAPFNLPTSLPSVPNLPSSLELYAMPMDPTSVSLNVEQESGEYWPWIWSFLGPDAGESDQYVLEAGAAADWLVAEGACATVFVYLSPDGDNPTSWGWSDSYYIGHPGYMTWVAGKTNETELAGLGDLRWLNPNSSAPSEVSYMMGQSNLPWYTGSATGSSILQIPAFVGITSSQVEGTGVTAEDESLVSELGNIIDNLVPTSSSGEADSLSGIASALGPLVGMVPIDSTPHLIGVYLPNGTAGTSMWIYH